MTKKPRSNATTPKPKGQTPTFTVENTPRDKLLRMGQNVDMGQKGKPSTGP